MIWFGSCLLIGHRKDNRGSRRATIIVEALILYCSLKVTYLILHNIIPHGTSHKNIIRIIVILDLHWVNIMSNGKNTYLYLKMPPPKFQKNLPPYAVARVARAFRWPWGARFLPVEVNRGLRLLIEPYTS